jgi:integrase
MARKVRDKDLDSRTARAKLKIRGKPYFRALDEGLHIGYRKGKTSGKWVVRYYLDDGKYEIQTLDGVADDKADANGIAVLSFSQAQHLIRKKDGERKAAARTGAEPPAACPYKVRNAIEDYLNFLKEKRRTERDARYRAEAFILSMLGDTAGGDLTNETLQAWLVWLAEQPPRVRSQKNKDQKFRAIDPDDEEARRRRQSSAMRVWTILKAALNQAWRARKIDSDVPWRTVRPFEDVDAARVRWLTNDESRRLINASSEGEFRTLVHAALQTGVRFGALANLNVDDFSVHPVRLSDGATGEQGSLHILTRKGRGGKVKHVNVMLTDEGIKFFRRITQGRHGSAPMLPRADGSRWQKSQPDRLIKEASRAARIDPPISFHVLRHTWASQAVMNGVSLMVVAKNLGHSDTRMVEKHYGHLAPSFIVEAIQAGAPRFGSMPEDGEVDAIRR